MRLDQLSRLYEHCQHNAAVCYRNGRHPESREWQELAREVLAAKCAAAR